MLRRPRIGAAPDQPLGTLCRIPLLSDSGAPAIALHNVLDRDRGGRNRRRFSCRRAPQCAPARADSRRRALSERRSREHGLGRRALRSGTAWRAGRRSGAASRSYSPIWNSRRSVTSAEVTVRTPSLQRGPGSADSHRSRQRIPPEPLTRTELEALGEDAFEDYNRQRQGGGTGWLTAVKTPRVKGIVSFEPGSGFVFPEGEVPPPIRNAPSTPSPASRSRWSSSAP